MNPNPRTHAEILAARREILITQCALQRIMIVTDTQSLLQPLSPSGWRRFLPQQLGVPLAIGGLVLGIVAAKRGGTLPALQLGAGLWALARKILPLLHRAQNRSPD